MGAERPRIGRPVRVPGEKPTRERILEAAIDLFAEHGYDGTSMRQVARSVGLTESAVYRHYPGKKAILDAVFALAASRIYAPLPVPNGAQEQGSVFRSLLLPVAAIIAGSPLIVKIVRILYAEMHHNPEIRRYYQREYVDKAGVVLEAIFRDQIEKGLLRQCDPAALARVFGAFRFEWAFHSFIVEHDEPVDPAALARDLEEPIRLFEQLLAPMTGTP